MPNDPRIVVLIAAACALAGPVLAQAQPRAGQQIRASQQSYERRDDCVAGGLLSEAQCEFAYRNARAEYEEKTPRYASRATCERAHRRCAAQISGAGSFADVIRSGASYVPRFKGIRIVGNGEGARVLPDIEGSGRIGFQPRQVAALDARVAGRQGLIGDPASTRGRGRDVVQSGPGTSGPFVRRGDRDDTIRVPLQTRDPSRDAAPGLYVDRDGVEWYRPARRR